MNPPERTPEELRRILGDLVELQIVDREILQTSKQLEVFPGQLKTLDARLAEEKAAHDQAMTATSNHELERRSLERDIKEIEEKIAAEQARQSGRISNEAYQAITKEIEYLKTKMDKAETRILETLEEEEQHRERLKEAEERFQRFQAENDAERKRIREQVRTKKEKIERLVAERDHRREKIPADVLRLYDRLSERTPGNVVVPAVNGHCGGCHVALVSQKMVDIRQMKRFVQCEGCLRVFTGEEKSA